MQIGTHLVGTLRLIGSWTGTYLEAASTESIVVAADETESSDSMESVELVDAGSSGDMLCDSSNGSSLFSLIAWIPGLFKDAKVLLKMMSACAGTWACPKV